jgi:DNA-binding CsgD family transcriptional regulator
MAEARLGRLRPFLASLKGSRNYRDLCARMMDGINHMVVPSRAWAIYRLDETLKPTDIAARNVNDAFLQRYEEAGRENDPMMAELIATHLPCHNLQTLSADQWHRHPLYLHLTSRLAGLDHVLQAPLLGDGRIIGTLNFGRCHGDPPYGDAEVAAVSVAAHHISTLLAMLPENDQEPLELTERELQIAELVARGLNNREIAECLAISRNTVKEALKRIFRKAHVDSRAELTARLAAASLLK